MNLEELRDAFRLDMDDTQEPPYWSDDLLARYFTQADSEAARRARLIDDSETAADADSNPVCVYSVSAGDTYITLNSNIIYVRRVKLASKDCPLKKVYAADLDRAFPGWQATAAADTIAYCTDFTRGKIYFFTAFAADDEVQLTVVRTPLKALADDEDEPEIPKRYHEGLLDWVKYRALDNMDIKERYDPAAAAKHLAAFTAEFGERSSAQDERWIEREQQYDSQDGTY